MQIPFIGGSYEGRSSDFNAQRCINLYCEIDKEGGKYPIAMFGTPGLVEFCDTGKTAPLRQLIEVGAYAYAVVGDTFYQIDDNGVATSKGALNTSSGYVWMEYNGPAGGQIMVVDNPYGYIYTISTGTLAQIPDADFPGASSLTFQDGYFIVSRPGTGEFWLSDSYDGTSWSALQYATEEGDPDNLASAFSDHRELWLVGTKTIGIWFDSGSGTPPFDRKIDEILTRGTSAAASLASEDNTIFWLDDRRMCQMAAGYTPKTISTRQIEYQWAQYSTVADAIGFAYSMEGHTFYVLTFPTGNATWVFDTATGFWHERMSFPSPFNNRWRANCYCKFGDHHLVGDYENGKIYRLDLDTYTDDGNTMKAVRRASAIHENRKTLFFSRLEIEFEAGVGLTTGQGSDPQAMLRWSDDGGHTWSNEHWASMGKMGEYTHRAIWRRLGRSRNRVFELSITDPVKRVILSAHADIKKGTS